MKKAKKIAERQGTVNNASNHKDYSK